TKAVSSRILSRKVASYAPAWQGLGQAQYSQASYGYVLPKEEGFRKAQESIGRALMLDPDLASAHASMGYINMLHKWDWTAADASFQRALENAPGEANAIRGAASLAWIL